MSGRSMLLGCIAAVLLGTAPAVSLRAAEGAAAPAPTVSDPAALSARVAELEREVKKLQALVDADWVKSRAEQTERERARLQARIDELRAEIDKAGAEAKDSKALAELLTLVNCQDASVRRYLATAMSTMPKELVAPTLAKMVGDQEWSVSTEAVTSLLRLGSPAGCDTAAARAKSMLLEDGSAVVYGGGTSYSRQGFFMAACNYLTRNNDVRGVAAYMRQLQENLDRQEALNPNGTVATSYYYGNTIMAGQSFENLNRWTGARVVIPKGQYGSTLSAEQSRAVAKLFLGWWAANKDTFRLPVAAIEAPKPEAKGPDANRPEQF